MLGRHVRPYSNGRDLMGRSRDAWVIDLLGLTEIEVRQRYPQIYQHLLRTVKPERRINNRASYRDNWWLFGEPRRELRPAIDTLPRFIVTVETAKHRLFTFVDAATLPDNKLICITLAGADMLGILQSRIHLVWYLANAGMIGVYHQPAVYVKTSSFDPFPFPEATPEQSLAIADLAEELDATRKAVLAMQGDLTLTGLYNLRDAVLGGATLDNVDEDRRRRGCVDILIELHDRIDAAVASAYGWPADLPDAELVVRLVALNAARAAEERAGTVRWLRPAYQVARAGIAALPVVRPQPEQIEALLPAAAARKPAFPRDAIGQTAAVLWALRGGVPMTAIGIAGAHAQGRKVERRVLATLEALERLGHVASVHGTYRLRRVA